jgi:Rrf2 family protein
MLSRSTAYALKALAHLAALPPGTLAGAREIAAATGAPMPFLWKILRTLTQHKVIRASKGVHGGYELARPARRISLIEVTKATQRANPVTRCVLDPSDCNAANPCMLHDIWSAIRARTEITLQETTIADLANPPRRVRSKKARRSRTSRKS